MKYTIENIQGLVFLYPLNGQEYLVDSKGQYRVDDKCTKTSWRDDDIVSAIGRGDFIYSRSIVNNDSYQIF